MPIEKSLKQILDKLVPQRLKDLVGLINKMAYRGDAYQCPICMSKLRAFYPLLKNFRMTLEIDNHVYTPSDFETLNCENYLCPVCRCADRDRLYALYLKTKSESFTQDTTLVHFAPERALSRYLKRLSKTGTFRYRTADLLMKKVDDRMDITRMDAYKTESVGCFICSHVLEHVPDDTKALEELYRILKPQGWGILMVPVIPALKKTYEDFSKSTAEERLKHFGQEDHVRVYSKNDFVQKMQSAGFRIQQLSADNIGKDRCSRAGISMKSILYVVEK